MAKHDPSSTPPVAFFECRNCHASARFVPLYRFNQSGDKPQLLVAPTIDAMIKCGNCNNVYRWVPPADGKDGGWVAHSFLDDMPTT